MAETLYYTSPEHKKRFLTAMLTSGKVYDGKLDPEYASALYILTSSAGTWQKASSFVDRDGIDFEAMLAEVDFSGGYGVLIHLAGNLFNDRFTCSPVDICTRLDSENFTIALTALQIRRVSWALSEIANKAELYNAEIDERNRINAANREKPWLPLHDGE